jgi:hypothetical protein
MAEEKGKFDELDRAIETCRTDLQDKRLDIIRDKVQLSDDEISSAPDRKPTAVEVIALRLLFAARVRCDAAVDRGIAKMLESQPAKSPLWFHTSIHEQLSTLALLMNGYVTYRDLLDWQKAKTDESLREAEATKKKAAEEAQNAQARQNLVLLTCIGERPEMARGIEFQYRIDQQNNSVWASRGSGAPRDVRVGDSEITFYQAESRVTISRLTGLFSIVTGSVAFTGRCTRATSRAF